MQCHQRSPIQPILVRSLLTNQPSVSSVCPDTVVKTPATEIMEEMYRLTTTTTFPLPREEVFKFFSAAENLEKITPASLQFRILTPGPITMREGLLIDYRIKIQGIPAKWRTRISQWNPPHDFIDEQITGPYHTWIHRHSFTETAQGTEMQDQVDYRLPLEPIGRLAHPIIRFQLKRIFAHRTRIIPQYLCPTMTEKVKASPILFQRLESND